MDSKPDCGNLHVCTGFNRARIDVRLIDQRKRSFEHAHVRVGGFINKCCWWSHATLPYRSMALHLLFHRSVDLSVDLAVHQWIHQFTSPSVRLSVDSSGCPLIPPAVRRFVRPCVGPSGLAGDFGSVFRATDGFRVNGPVSAQLRLMFLLSLEYLTINYRIRVGPKTFPGRCSPLRLMDSKFNG